MALKLNLVGKPSIPHSMGEFGAPEKQLEITQASNPDVSITSVIRAALAIATAGVKMVLDPIARVLFVADAALQHTPAVKRVMLKPTGGQEGRSLVWEMTPVGAVPASITAAITAALAPVAPKRSLESMIAAALEALPDDTKRKVVVEVDQATAIVNLLYFDTEAAARGSTANCVDAVTGADNGAVITLAGAPVETNEQSGDSSLPFEGGVIPGA